MSTVASPGCVVFLVDESAGMGAVVADVVADGTKSSKPNAERVATALNALLNQLTGGPDFDVALVGYRADAAGQADVGCRWDGSLSGRKFVGTGELSGAALRTETRTRRLASPDGFSPPHEETVSFPIWYVPALGERAPQVAAYRYACELLRRWAAGAGLAPGTPLVVHVSAGASGDGNPQRAVDELLKLPAPVEPPLLLQVHLGGKVGAVPALYPTNPVYLTVGGARDLFHRASPLPPHLVEALKQVKINVNPGARGMLYNAKMVDVIRCLGLVAAHTRDWPSKGAVVPAELVAAAVAEPAVAEPAAVPPAAQEAPAVAEPLAPAAAIAAAEPPPLPPALEKAALVVLVLDRSLEDPYSGRAPNPIGKLQDQANDILRQIGNLEQGAVEAAIISYGLDASGGVEVRDAFDGPLAGRATAAQTELAAGALRTEETEEQVPDGTGNLITLRRQRPIYFDLEPTPAAPMTPAFAAAAQIVALWCGQHHQACLPPLVLHLTRGAADPAESEQAVAAVRELATVAGPAVLCHLVMTEGAHKSLAYPDSEEALETPSLKKLWQLSSPLLGCERWAAERPTLIKAGGPRHGRQRQVRSAAGGGPAGAVAVAGSRAGATRLILHELRHVI